MEVLFVHVMKVLYYNLIDVVVRSSVSINHILYLSIQMKFLLSVDETGIRLLTVSGSRMGWTSPTSQTYGQVNLGSNMRYITTFDVDNRTNTYFWSDLAANTIYSRTERANNYTKVNQIFRKTIFSKIINSIFLSLFQVEIVM